MPYQETRIRQELKDLVVRSTEESRREGKVLLKDFWEIFAVKVKVLMLYQLLKLRARAGYTSYDVMEVPAKDILPSYQYRNDGELEPYALDPERTSAKVYEAVRRNGYRPKIIWVEDIRGEEGRYDHSHWAIRIDWSE